jgi:hypothetical protein
MGGLPLTKIMKREEKVTLEYLKIQHGNNVFPMPKHKDPPDILVNSTIAVEVRRLNQHFFEEGDPEGLDNLSIPLQQAFEEVLKSFEDLFKGKSYWVSIDYQRPLKSDLRNVKKEMKQALQNFLNTETLYFPHEISVNPEITFTLQMASARNENLFSNGASGDSDAGGWVIGVYTDNIRHCINEKSLKVSERLKNYNEWWLYLVDYMCFGSKQEFLEVARNIGDTGNFDKVVVLDYHGQNVLATIQRE